MGFRFSDRPCLKIEGIQYSVDPFSRDTNESALNFGKKLAEIKVGEVLTGNSRESADAVRECVVEMTDAVLGAGAYDKISAERNLDILDHIELGTYIAQSVTSFRDKRIERFIGSVAVAIPATQQGENADAGVEKEGEAADAS